MKKYKKGDLVLYRAREGMAAVPGRIGVAEIVKVKRTSSFTGYDTKPFSFKKTAGNNWLLSMFDYDIICRVSKKNAAECHRTMAMTYAVHDKIFESLKSGLTNVEESITEHLKAMEKLLKRKSKK